MMNGLPQDSHICLPCSSIEVTILSSESGLAKRLLTLGPFCRALRVPHLIGSHEVEIVLRNSLEKAQICLLV